MYYKCVISSYKCVISVLCDYVFYKCVISGYKCVICVFVAIFGKKLIFGLTGLRTMGPSDLMYWYIMQNMVIYFVLLHI